MVSAALTVREQLLLQDAHSEIRRLHEFQRVHVLVSQDINTLGRDPVPDPETRAEAENKINLLIGLVTIAVVFLGRALS